MKKIKLHSISSKDRKLILELDKKPYFYHWLAHLMRKAFDVSEDELTYLENVPKRNKSEVTEEYVSAVLKGKDEFGIHETKKVNAYYFIGSKRMFLMLEFDEKYRVKLATKIEEMTTLK